MKGKSNVRIKSLILCALFAITSVGAAGCGKKAEESNSKSSQQVKVVRVWTGDRHSQDVMTQKAEEFNNTIGKEKGIKIDYKVFSDDLPKVIDMAHASGQAPELHGAAGNLKMFAANGWTVPISDMPGGEELIQKSNVREIRKISIKLNGGKIYSLPTSIMSFKMVYNKDLFKKAGIVDDQGQALPPKTWNDVIKDAKIITQQGNGVEYGLVYAMKHDGFFSNEVVGPFAASIGNAEWNFNKGKFDYAAFAPAFTEYLLKVKADKSFVPGPEGLDNDSARAMFADGKIGMKISGSYDVGVFNSQFKAKCDWGVADVPVLDENKRYKTQVALNNGIVITSQAKSDPEKVMEVFKWYYSDDTRAALFKAGKDLPYQEQIIKKAGKVTDIKGWQEFSDLSKNYFYKDRPYPPQGEGDTPQQVFMKIWLGILTPKEGLEDLDKRMTQQMQGDLEKGKYKLEDYIEPDFDVSVK